MSNQPYSVLLYYKYVKFSNPEAFRQMHYDFCQKNGIRGRVFIAFEGINGTVSGTDESITLYKEHIRSFPEFSDIVFKEDKTEGHCFKKLIVRFRREIVSSSLEDIMPGEGVKRLKPEQLKSFYDEGKDFIIVDARNDYESMIGYFRQAMIPQIKNFRQWSDVAEQLKSHKERTIVTYCTGGIRCEKAAAYLSSQGFKDVYQLDGGIINYIKQFPDTHFLGSLFVFDERRSIEVNTMPEIKHVARCYFCNEPASYYINCHNQDCDKIIVSCQKCKIENEYCCSEQCRKSKNKRKKIHG